MQIHQPILRLFFGHNGSRILYDVQYHLTLIERTFQKHMQTLILFSASEAGLC